MVTQSVLSGAGTRANHKDVTSYWRNPEDINLELDWENFSS